jgi:ribosomal protein L37AE/L43A
MILDTNEVKFNCKICKESTDKFILGTRIFLCENCNIKFHNLKQVELILRAIEHQGKER